MQRGRTVWKQMHRRLHTLHSAPSIYQPHQPLITQRTCKRTNQPTNQPTNRKAYISRLKLEGLALASDMVYVTQSAGRIMRCLAEICLKRGWAGVAERALTLCKEVGFGLVWCWLGAGVVWREVWGAGVCRVRQGLWKQPAERAQPGRPVPTITLVKPTIHPQVNHRMWNSQSPLRQFKGVPNDVLVRLEKKDLVSFGGGG
jgi:hypothetical protein